MGNRRKLMVALGTDALAAPLRAFTQQKREVWRVGFLASRHRPTSLDGHSYGAFLRGMHELGYIEGKNIVIEWCFSDARPDRLAALAEELGRLNVDVLITDATGATRAGQKATTTVPIVMVGSGDPVDAGLVKTLARPGGNIAGLSTPARETTGKRLEMTYLRRMQSALLLQPIPRYPRPITSIASSLIPLISVQQAGAVQPPYPS